jgi:hypothetical protein
LIKQDITQGNSQPILEHASFPDTQVVIDLPQPFDPPAAPVPILITIEDFISFFSKGKESTSTSPSDKHLGHYLALLFGFDYKNVTAAANRIIEAHVNLLNIAVNHGLPLPCWLHIVSVMIQKKAGNYQLQKLRTIHLFEG